MPSKTTRKITITSRPSITKSSAGSALTPFRSSSVFRLQPNNTLGLVLIFLGIFIILGSLIYYLTPNHDAQSANNAFVFYTTDELTDEELTGAVETDFNLENGTATNSAVN